MPDSRFTLMIHLPNGVTSSVLTDASSTTTALLEWCISTFDLEEYENLRLYGLRTGGQPAVELKDDDLVQPYALTGVRIAPEGKGDVAVPEQASWRQLCEQLPRVGLDARYDLWRDLEQLPEGAIDRASIKESRTGTVLSDEAKQVQQQVRVVDFTNMTFNRVRFGGAEFVPTEATNKHVTLSPAQCVSFMSVPEQHYPELTRLQAELCHPLKLLRDLPIALANSRAAQKKAAASEDRDLTELGAIAYEQHRIEEEITEQQTKVHAIRQQIEAIITTSERVEQRFHTQIHLSWYEMHQVEGASVIAFQDASAKLAWRPPAADAAKPEGLNKRKRVEDA
jgi:hypothetical protein